MRRLTSSQRDSGSVLFLGGGSEDGDLVLRDAQGRQRLFANGGQPFLRCRLTIGAAGNDGDAAR